MPHPGHKTVTVTHDTLRLIEEIRNSFPLQVSQGEVVRGALLVLFDQEDPLDAIARAKRRVDGMSMSRQDESST